MSCIHYKFRSSLEYKTLTFEGLHISVTELKRLIYENEKINRSSDFDLQITNAQTKQVYDEDNSLVPRNASVTVARIPAATQQKLPKVWDRSTEGVVTKGYNRLGDMSGASNMTSEKKDFSKMSELTEEEKLKQMEKDSTSAYDPSNFQRRRAVMTGLPPPNYVCNRCHQTGHWINQCPTLNMRRTTGIPKDELMETTPDDPQAMLNPDGTYSVQKMHKDAKLRGKKERPPFVDEELVEVEPEERSEISDAYLCVLCRGLLKEAMLIDCCWTSFCADCITNRLLESDRHQCPNCGRQGISPDSSLFPNTKLRQAVENFQKEIGYGNVRKRVNDERGNSATPPPHRTGVDINLQHNKLKISFAPPPAPVQERPKIETMNTGSIVVTTTYFGQGESGNEPDVKTSTAGSSTTLQWQPIADQTQPVVTSTVPIAVPQVQTQPAVSHPTAVVLPQPVYPNVSSNTRTPMQPNIPSSMQNPVNTLTYSHSFTPSSTSGGIAYPSYPNQPLQSAAPTGYPQHHVANAPQSYHQPAYLPQYPSQPPPPGISAGSLSSLQSFSRPPPTLVAPPPSHRPLTEEEFYLEKQRLLRRPASSSASATRDAWEEFLARKDRKKIRSSPSTSSSSGRSRSHHSRSSTRSRSPRSRTRSRSPRSRRVKYRRRPRRYVRSRSRSPRRRHRSRSRTRSRSPPRHSSSSRHHYTHSLRSPDPFYNRPVYAKRPEYITAYAPPPAPPPYYVGGGYPAAPAPYNQPMDPRFMKMHHYPYEPAPPGGHSLEFVPKSGRNAYHPPAPVASKVSESHDSPRSDDSATRTTSKNVERKKRPKSPTPDEKQLAKKPRRKSKSDAVASEQEPSTSTTTDIVPSTPADVPHSDKIKKVAVSSGKLPIKRSSSTKNQPVKVEKATEHVETKKSKNAHEDVKKSHKPKAIEKIKKPDPVPSKSVESTKLVVKTPPPVVAKTIEVKAKVVEAVVKEEIVEKQQEEEPIAKNSSASDDQLKEDHSSSPGGGTEKETKSKKKKDKKKRKKKHKLEKESTSSGVEGKTKRHHHKKHKKEKRKSVRDDPGDDGVKEKEIEGKSIKIEDKLPDEVFETEEYPTKSKWERNERKGSPESREIKKKITTKTSSSDKKPTPKSTVTKASSSSTSSLDKKILTAAENALSRKVPKPLTVSTSNVHSSSSTSNVQSSTSKRDRKVVLERPNEAPVRKTLLIRRNR